MRRGSQVARAVLQSGRNRYCQDVHTICQMRAITPTSCTTCQEPQPTTCYIASGVKDSFEQLPWHPRTTSCTQTKSPTYYIIHPYEITHVLHHAPGTRMHRVPLKNHVKGRVTTARPLVVSARPLAKGAASSAGRRTCNVTVAPSLLNVSDSRSPAVLSTAL